MATRGERKPVKLVVVGAGNRGTNYSNYALEHADLCQVLFLTHF
jgi:hypothetical protein